MFNERDANKTTVYRKNS